ncbi:cyclic AMP-responsive element-binding protein 3-like protein 1 [Thunnus albacares]|uniref:cyclic AMP-responsive element-binding protein 3-like protein 1 n=2 Tax=Thunnus TaxID=8234 RepID=UPI001C4CBCB2|nr:cyclic AMP-responsive element-binding protein 3-like protein 1 isoform X1 [Thunnus maccoyii]XP_042261142.1 cyclic AMP-responsive element-binding protein 3-like protein 1 isoform X1 [Thunnus maccoyii]XP_044200932.1 cyclic AMP-responsive element-binding protein 3-like protein 1 [Thunnus albacares]
MMESILDSLTAEKLYPSGGTNLLDLEELSDGDFLTNVPFSGDQMDDFSSELFSSFFEDHLLERPLLADRSSLLHMDIDSSPDIQAEHSYSLSEDSAPQSPALSIKMDQESEFEWSFSQDLSAILVKQEEPDVGQRLDPQPLEGPPLILSPAPPHRGSPWKHTERSQDDVKPVAIKDEPREIGQYLSLPSDDALQLPPTPPSSNHGDSDGSLPPSSPHLPLPPSSPQPQQRPGGRASSSSSSSSSTAISSSPLLTAPHKLQGSGPLMLTEEEKRTLVAEGYPVPNKLPLTKSEEKALKRVRRKIKNKISAQESRRKKKEYVECLEKKVESYTSENSDLWRKVENLETANRSLLQQLQKLQSLISGKVVPRSCKMASTQTGTCLMMMAVCFVLVLGSFSPCLSPFYSLAHSSSLSSSSSSNSPSSSPSPQSADLYTTSQVRSRSLLFYNEGAPLEETSVTSEGERLQSEGHSHIQTSRYTADAHSNQTTGPKLDRRETKPDGVSEFF